MANRMSQVAYLGEPGAALARTQDAVALDPFDEDEDAASAVIWPMKCQPTNKMGH